MSVQNAPGYDENRDAHIGSIAQEGSYSNVFMQEGLITEAGAGTYTLRFPLPAGNRIIDIGVEAMALWTAATSASLIAGDDSTTNGFFTTTNLKATDLLVGETNTIEHDGGLGGAYIAQSGQQRVLFNDGPRTVAFVATSVGAGTAGRTRCYVVYSVAQTIAAIKS